MSSNDHQDLLNYLPKDNLFKDKVILVTGASAGMGRAMSLAYARFGATVVLLDKKIKDLEKIYDEIEALNAAWLPSYIPFKEYEVELWLKTITVNLHANFLITKACLPLLEKSSDPSIIFSAHGSIKAYNGAFGVAKAGSAAMIDILAQEYDNPDNFIRVNSIDTGPIRTQMRKMNFPGEDIETLARPEAIVGPYLYFMGVDAAQRTNEKIAFERLDANLTWAGEV